jgi:hypothetical protein
MRSRQQGLSLINLIVGLTALALIGIMAAKLVPAYTEFLSIKKVLVEMETTGETRKTVREIRDGFDRRTSIAYITTVQGADLEISKEGGEILVAANYKKTIPIVANVSFCIDFVATNKMK